MAENSIQRSSSRPKLELGGAAIDDGNFNEKEPCNTILLPNQSDDISQYLALDIGGSLIKLMYFSRNENNNPGGKLNFVKFETSKIDECLDFIKSNQIHVGGLIKATGGGAHNFADKIKKKLGVILEKENEFDCLVAGTNFLLNTIPHEAFVIQHTENKLLHHKKEFLKIGSNDLYPYLLVNIGSGVSVFKVEGDGIFKRVTGSNIGGGTFWGLAKLLTKCKSFAELLEMSQRGDNKKVDMLVGDIYGGKDCNTNLGLSASTIASSFGKVISLDNELEDYSPEDIALALLRMISYNIAQIAFLKAEALKLKRIFFGGFFIGGQVYTMDTISFAVNFWSKGNAQAMFLRHEGFLGALGAYEL